MRILSAAVPLAAILGVASSITGQSSDPSLLRATFSNLPICFIENRGVYPEPVRFYAPGKNRTIFFTPGGVTLRLGGAKRWTVKLDFPGASDGVEPRGEVPTAAVVSYFTGPRDDWKTGL